MGFFARFQFGDLNNINVSGDLNIIKKNGVVELLDGWKFNATQKQTTGYFNFIRWNKKVLKIENDDLGYRPLYFSTDEESIIISNNFWDLIAAKSQIEVNYALVEQLISFRRLTPSYKTIVKGVFRVPAGSSVTIEKNKQLKIEKKKYFQQNANYKLSVEEAASQLNNAFLNQFQLIKDNFDDREIWFGNSGGLDSRLIPAYSKKFNLSINGYIVSNTKPKGFINQSIKSGNKISKKYNFFFKKIDFREGDGWKRLLRDIYVSPFGPANFIKNPLYEYFSGKLILNGGNSFLIANDNNFWIEAIKSQNPTKSFIQKYLTRSSCENINDELFDNYYNTVVHELSGIDHSFDKMRNLHQTYLNFTSSTGGFESMSSSGDALTIYYPFASNAALNWPEKYFYNRVVQNKLFEKYFPDLLEVRNQKGNTPYESNKFNEKIISKLSKKLRSNGLDYYNWVKSNWFADILVSIEEKVLKSTSDQAKEILRKAKKQMGVHDRLSLLKLSLIVLLLEDNKLLMEILNVE